MFIWQNLNAQNVDWGECVESHAHNKPNCRFKKRNWPYPDSFSFTFGLFETTIQFFQEINVKK